MKMKELVFLTLITLIFSQCSDSTPFSYNNQCVSSCKEYNLFRDRLNCKSSCSTGLIYEDYKVINPDNKDNYCITDCLLLGKSSLSYQCYDNCKENGWFKYRNRCYQSCKFDFSALPTLYYKYFDINENYCISNCLIYGLNNDVDYFCTKNCKEIGKYLENDICVSKCQAQLGIYITNDENYCTNCYYHDLVLADGTKTCVESCKSIGQLVNSRGKCIAKETDYKLLYENENYNINDCELYGLVKGPSNMCVKNCKENGKVRDVDKCDNQCKGDYYSEYRRYPYQYENEIYCLNQKECSDLGKNPSYKNNIYSCDEMDIVECNQNEYYSIPDGKCVNSCRKNNLFLFKNLCISSCPIFSKYIYNGPDEDICLNQCPDNAPYLNYDSKKCVENCNNLPIFENKCLNNCPISSAYINEIDNKKYCIKNCHLFGLYNMINEMTCTDNCKKYSLYLLDNNCFYSCPSESPYKYNGESEYTCHKNCDEVGLLTDIEDKICVSNCKNRGKKNLDNRCISYCPTSHKYIFSENENEDYCVKNCSIFNQRSIYSIDDEIKCIGGTCKENGLSLLNDVCLQCPFGLTFVVKGINENICTENCNEYGLVPHYSNSSCINSNTLTLSCSSDEFKDFINKRCTNKCPEELSFVHNSICVKRCEKYYYEDSNGNKICIDDCNSKYIIVNQGKCISSCQSIDNYQLNGFNICFSYCNEHSIIQRYNFLTKDIFSKCIQNCLNNDNTKNKDDCTKDCLRPFKYEIYNNPNKICYQSCEEINKYEFIDDKGNYMCIDDCKTINKINDKNKCIDICPQNKIKSQKNGIIECVENCENNEFKIYNKFTKEFSCVNNCKDNNLFLDINKCVNECPIERPFVVSDNNEQKCSEECQNNLYLNIDQKTQKRECVNSCISLNKFINDNKCVEQCPKLKNYKIINNNEIYCSFSCDNQNKYINKENNDIFCVNDCAMYNKKNYNGECISDDCPEGKYLNHNKQTNEVECIDDCRINNLFINDNKCVDNCSTFFKFSFQGKCISECPEGLYLYEDIVTNEKSCVSDCKQLNMYLNDNKCIEGCSTFNKVIFNGECLSKCPEKYNYIVDGECRMDPCDNGKFYDFINKICLDKCDINSNYLDIDTDLCVNSCRNINSISTYSIQGNKCINNCNEQNKYLYLYNNDYYCLDNCEINKLVISEDGKFCIGKCSNEFPFIKNGQCIKSCDKFYINNINKYCIEKCPQNLPYIYNNECISSCYNNGLYQIYKTNICVEKCSENLILNIENKPQYFMDKFNSCLNETSNNQESCSRPFYLSDNENKICYQDCNQSNFTKYISKNKECVGVCPNGIKENNICNDTSNQIYNLDENDNDDLINNDSTKNTTIKNKDCYIIFNYLITLISLIIIIVN